MVKIKTLQVGYLQTNCYILTTESYDGAVIIDAGGGYEKIKDYLQKEGKKPTAVLLTHGHFDHIMAVSKLSKEGAKVYIHKADSDMLLVGDKIVADMHLKIEPVTADFFVEDNQKLTFGDIELTVVHTPGHTRGGVCYVMDEAIFSGDTIFYLSYGRTDFVGGSMEQLKDSITNKIFSLKGEYTVYPGHDMPTKLSQEKKYNPILVD